MLLKYGTNLSVAAALGGGLVIICLWPELANVSVILAQVLAVGVCLLTGSRRDFLRPSALMPLVAGLLLVVAFGITATSLLHVAMVLVFTPLFLIAPLVTVMRQSSFRIGPGAIGALATAGAGLAMLVAIYDSMVLHSPRAGGIVANPIHFADVTVALGFLSLLGLFGERKWKWVAVAGATFALIAIALSGTRGAMVAVLTVAVLACLLAAVSGWLNRRSLLALCVVAVAGGGAVGLALQSNWSPAVRIAATLSSIAETGATSDSSDDQRLLMYRGAYNAFLQSPFYGHGMIGFAKVAADTLPPELNAPVYDHLHSDIADFAVTGGFLGIIAYFCILLAPIVEAVRSSGPGRVPAIFAACTLSASYFCMGLTNATFGILMLTVTFAVATAAIAHLARLPARDLSQAPDVLNTPRSPHRLADAPIA